jgi:hypothetical protein
MRRRGPRGTLGPCPGRPGTEPDPERSRPMLALKTARAYARYALTALAAVSFRTISN